MDPILSPEEQRRKEVEDAIRQLKNPDNSAVDQARSNAGTQDIIAAVGRALEGYVRAPAVARGGQGVDPTVYNAIAESAQRDVQAAQAKQDAVKKAILESMALKHQAASEERMDKQAAEIARHNIATEQTAAEALKPKPISAAEQADLEFKQSQLEEQKRHNIAVEQNEANKEAAKLVAEATKPAPKTEGEVAYDKKIADELAQYQAGGGSAAVNLSISKLKTIADDLEKQGENTLGVTGQRLIEMAGAIKSPFGAHGALVEPSTIRKAISPTVAGTQEEISAVLLPGMKAVFTGPTSEKEMENFLKTGYSPTQSNLENAKKLRAQIKEMETKRDVKEGLLQRFQEQGTLQTRNQPVNPVPTQVPATKTPKAASGALSPDVIDRMPPKYQAVLKNASVSGPKQLAITHFLMSQQDPEYQAAFTAASQE